MKINFENELARYMELRYTVVLRPDEGGDVIARVQELEGCIAHGSDESEALANLAIVKRLWLTTALEAGIHIPLPQDEDDLPSGKWVQRVPRSLHKRLVEIAKAEKVSLNSLVQTYLGIAVGQQEHRAEEIHPAQTVIDSLPYLGQSPNTFSFRFSGYCRLENSGTPSINSSWFDLTDPSQEKWPIYLSQMSASALLGKEDASNETTKKHDHQNRPVTQVH